MLVLDFETSSIAKRSFPIEVAWVPKNGRFEASLIRPAPGRYGRVQPVEAQS